MPARICIIGGGGYYGLHIAKEFQTHGYHTVILDVAFIKSPVVELDDSLTSRFVGTLLDRDLLCKALDNCEACIHVAAYGVRGGASLNKELCYRINVDGTNLVIECCKLKGVKRLVYSSSVSVIFQNQELFDSDESIPYPSPSQYYSHYCASKAIAEKNVLGSNCDEFRTCALRLRGIYGPAEPNIVQPSIELCQKGLFMATFEKSPNCVTQYSNIYNCAPATRLADEALRNGRACGKVYNIVDGGPPVGSTLFWKPVIEATGHQYPRLKIPYPIIIFLAFLFEKLYLLTGIEPMFTQLEINLMSISNTYSIENARRDLGYEPIENHDMSKVIGYYRKTQQVASERKKSYSTSFLAFSSFVLFLWMFSIWF